MSSFVPLEEVAQVSLGYKSLQNDFFYVNQLTIDSYRIESRYLRSISVFKSLDGGKYLQNPLENTWVFLCRDKEADLRGTGALRYIHAMAERPAAEKKQSGGKKSIREVLQEQGGGFWYAPKAKPNPAHIWVRKAFNTTFAPFLFQAKAVVDQRCNYVEPKLSYPWQLIASAITSTIFAYSLEINGSASMGAGALEAPTSKLRRYPIFNIGLLNQKERDKLIELGKDVWKMGKPIDWAKPSTIPDPHIQALDKWILARTGTNNVKLEQIYNDLRATCKSRVLVAQDKVKTSQKLKSDNVASVAQGVADNLTGLLNTKRFPEDFSLASWTTTPVHIPRGKLRQITIAPFINQAEIQFIGEGGKILLKETYPLAVAETIIRAALAGRENFDIPIEPENAQSAIAEFLKWFAQISERMSKAVGESAVGTGYEEAVRDQVYRCLRIHPSVATPTLPLEINCWW